MRKVLVQLLKSSLPEPLLRRALDARNAIRLALAPRRAFDASKLRPVREHHLDSVFRSSTVETTWLADHDAIEEVFCEYDRSGGVNPGDRRAIYYLIRAFDPKSVLEVGTHIGASTLSIGRALRSNGTTGRVTTVDMIDVNQPRGPWQQTGLAMAPRDLAARLDCAERIGFTVSPSLDFLRTTDRRFDFIFLDGDHGERAVYEEVAASLQVLEPNGVILLHDYYPAGRTLFPDDHLIPGPFRAMTRIQRECPEIDVIPLGHLPWPTKQGVNVTSLAMVTRREN